jgi:hypothetical protein
VSVFWCLFLVLVISHLCVINLVTSPLYVVNVHCFFPLLVDGDGLCC